MFRYQNFNRIGFDHAATPAAFSYNTDEDTLSQVVASGYFDDPRLEMREGDMILCKASDSSTPLLVTSGNSATPVQSAGTGWGQYSDDQYTSGSPLSLLADTDTVLPNNAAEILEMQKPVDVDTFYDGSVITGRNGDGILITVDFTAVPTNANTTALEVWFDIGGAVGELYRRIVTFPKGQGNARPVNFTVAGYTLGTWEQNGATTYVRVNGTCNIYNIRYVITRTHKAR